jgi:hypothetical protein
VITTVDKASVEIGNKSVMFAKVVVSHETTLNRNNDVSWIVEVYVAVTVTA